MTTQHLIRLREELAKIENDLRTLEGERKALRRAIGIVNDDPETSAPTTHVNGTPRKSREPLKETILRLLTESGDTGLVAISLVDLAQAQGITLDRNSVSSMLSRFKRDNVVEHVNGKYRIPRPTPIRVVA